MAAENRNRKNPSVRLFACLCGAALLTSFVNPGSGGEVWAASGGDGASASDEKVVLRIANWEEYIDEGGWDEEEIIELDDREVRSGLPVGIHVYEADRRGPAAAFVRTVLR